MSVFAWVGKEGLGGDKAVEDVEGFGWRRKTLGTVLWGVQQQEDQEDEKESCTGGSETKLRRMKWRKRKYEEKMKTKQMLERYKKRVVREGGEKGGRLPIVFRSFNQCDNEGRKEAIKYSRIQSAVQLATHTVS